MDLEEKPQVIIRCDHVGCSTFLASFPSHADAVAAARKAGWEIAFGGTGPVPKELHHCPEHKGSSVAVPVLNDPETELDLLRRENTVLKEQLSQRSILADS